MTTQLMLITRSRAEDRLREIRVMADMDYIQNFEEERQSLYLDILHTIANSTGFADKRELRRLAEIAMAAHEINPREK